MLLPPGVSCVIVSEKVVYVKIRKVCVKKKSREVVVVVVIFV